MRNWRYLVCRILARTFFRLFVRLQVWRTSGATEPAGAAVLVANHISHFDPFFLSFAFDRMIDWMTTEEFYANPLMAASLHAVNAFPVDRSRIGTPLSVSGMNKEQASARLAGVLRELGAAAAAHFALGPDDWPATPQRRKGRDARSTA